MTSVLTVLKAGWLRLTCNCKKYTPVKNPKKTYVPCRCGGITPVVPVPPTPPAQLPPTITTTSVNTLTEGVSFSQTFAYTSGTPPVTWSISVGTIPTGLVFSSGGVLSGTPTVSGAYSFTARIVDSLDNFDTQAYSGTVNAAAPPGDYPLGVVATDTEVTWDLQTTGCGLSGPQTKVIGVDTLPSGAVLSADGPHQPMLIFNGNCTLTDWDLRGRGYRVEANCVVNLVNCNMEPNPDYIGLYVWQIFNTLTATVNMTDCVVDGGDLPVGGFVHNPGTFNITRTIIRNFGQNWWNAMSGTLNLTDVWLSRCCTNNFAGGHYEGLHFGANANATYIRVLSDQRPGGATINQGPNGHIFAECNYGGPGPIFLSATDSIFIGATEATGLYSFAWGAAPPLGTFDLTMTNCVVEKGTSGAYGGGPLVTSSSLTNNCDLDTGVNIDANLAV